MCVYIDTYVSVVKTYTVRKLVFFFSHVKRFYSYDRSLECSGTRSVQ